ncbi:MAG: leucine-rich repeat domain-containing protein [Bacteroidales bacterium]|nr:leucine-rich repeat domain-containing protein [Bacteroidales bacterium]
MKRIVLLLLMTFIVNVGAWASDFEFGGISYNVTSSSDLTVEVTYIDNKYSGDVVIPSSVTYEGTTYSVTQIGDVAFYGCSGLTSVVIPSSVTRIGNDAFEECSGLTSVEIPSSVTEIGFAAFRDCSVLTSVTISEGVTFIDSYAFQGCYNLTSVTIPSTVTDIGVDAFPNPYDNEECKLSTITLLTKTHSVALKILGYYGTTADQYQYSGFHSKGYAAVYVADGLLPFYEWFWGGYYNFIEIGDVPNVINGEGGIASIVKVYNNKVDINVDLEEGYSVSEIKVNGKVVYTASASNKSLSVDVFVIKNSETSFTLVGVTADDTIEVAYNKSTPTGVGVIEMQREVKGVYDIYGRKLTEPQRGINIIDGKKVIVK